jgi:hypothetical protein
MDHSWLRAWIAALLACALVAGGYEWLLRSHGYAPTVQDDADLWSIQYDRLKRSPDAVALLGASRIEFSVDPTLLSRELGGRPVAMLAVNGKYPLAMLRALADDEQFTGLVVVGIDARGMQRKHWNMQQEYLDHYRHRWTLARRIHRSLLTWVQERLVLSRSSFSLTNAVERLISGDGLPLNEHVVVRADRVGLVDYRHPDLAWTHAKRVTDLEAYYRDNPPAASDVWLSDLETVSAWIKRIENRGGRVVFFREPVSGESLQLDEAKFPRSIYWDAYARISPAVLIDFRDVPALTAFALPDTSHIDGTDVPRFTIAFADLLKRRGFAPSSGSRP